MSRFALDLFPAAVATIKPDGFPCDCADCKAMAACAARVCDAVDSVTAILRATPERAAAPELVLEGLAILTALRLAMAAATAAGLSAQLIMDQIQGGAVDGVRYRSNMQRIMA